MSYLRRQKKPSVQSTSMISWFNSHDVISVPSQKRLIIVMMNVTANQAYLEKRTKSIKYTVHI